MPHYICLHLRSLVPYYFVFNQSWLQLGVLCSSEYFTFLCVRLVTLVWIIWLCCLGIATCCLLHHKLREEQLRILIGESLKLDWVIKIQGGLPVADVTICHEAGDSPHSAAGRRSPANNCRDREGGHAPNLSNA